MEYQALYDELDELAEKSVLKSCPNPTHRPWDDSPLQQQPVPEYICPNESAKVQSGMDTWYGPRTAAIASYFGSAGPASSGPLDWGKPNVCGKCIDSIACPCILPPTGARWFYHGSYPDGPGMLDMWPNKISVGKVLDGTSKTLHVGESHWSDPVENRPGCFNNMQWMASYCVSTTVWGINTDYVSMLGFTRQQHLLNNFLTGCNFRSLHPGGAHFLFADGSVTFLFDDISDTLLANLGDRKDGRVDGQYTPP